MTSVSRHHSNGSHAFTGGKIVRVSVAVFFIAATAIIAAAAIPNVAAAAANWSAPLNVDGSNSISAVSCATSLFCAAADQAGNVLTYNGSSWSTPDSLTEGEILSVSCPSTTFCVAVGSAGAEEDWNGSSWESGPVGSETYALNSISCTSSHFCVAVDANGGADTWNGTSWTGPTVVDPDNSAFVSVSCATSSYCVAVTIDGYAYTYNGASWTSGELIDGVDNLQSVSCTSSLFCVAVDAGGNAVLFDGSSWNLQNIDTQSIDTVFCSTVSFCVAGDTNGNVLTYDGTSWSSANIDSNAINSLSCATPSFCVAVDNAGNAATYAVPANQSDWSAPLNVDGSGLLASVSCASSQFCVATDNNGQVLTYNGSSWSPPNQITEGGDLYVSCPTSTFCVAVGGGGGENTWNGSTWNGPGPVGSDDRNLESVSCTSSHFCVAVDNNGGADTWNGATWTGPTTIDATNLLNSVSCTSSTFCVAVDQFGNAMTYNGASWTSPSDIDGSNSLNTVSCTSSTFCVAVDSEGNALTYDGSSWSTDDIDGSTQLPSVDCATTSFCVAGDTNGNVLTYNGSSWSSVTIDDNVITSVSCPTTSFCAATDDAGNVMTYGWVSADYTCNFEGFGSTSTPVLLSESPSPPPSITAPGTFQTTLSAEVTIPSGAVNYDLSAGATSITIGSQSTETDGLTPSDTPSSSVSPNTLMASATNLPISFTPQSNTPYTYPTTYNPETWQTVNVPGTVDFTPGNIDFTLTYVSDGVPTPQSVDCTPPSGVTELDSTDVTAPVPTPSFQVPPSVPPLSSQVSAPFDAGWSIEIANTSTVDVNGLSAQVTVSDGGGTLTYDLSGMAATGTTCTSSGTNKATCDVGTLAGGATDTLNILVETNGVATGKTITGSVNVTSTNASTQSSSLTAVNVVVVTNGAAAVAVPNVPLKSSTAKLSTSLANVTLKLPKKVPAMGPFEPAIYGGGKVHGPPVPVTLVPLAGSQDPELCPPSSGGCEGEIIEIEGNFANYTSTSKPISAVIEIYYGSSVPAGSIYFQDSASSTPNVLPACVKTGGHYNTPCVDGPEQTVGGSGKKAAEYTIFFTGDDPLVGRR